MTPTATQPNLQSIWEAS